MLYETMNGYKLLVERSRATEIADFLVLKNIQVYELRFPYKGNEAWIMISAYKEDKSKIADTLVELEKRGFVDSETDQLPY